MPVPDDPELTPAKDRPESYDPATVPPLSTGPEPSSETPAPDEEPHPGDVNGPESGTDDEEDLPSFDEKVAEPFQGLLYLGALKDTFEWAGHRFSIRTLRTQELADVAFAVQPYDGTVAQLRAYQAGVVAACLLDIDGMGTPFPVPLKQGDNEFQQRFAYVMKNWFAPTLDAIYRKYVDLELLVQRVVEAMGNPLG